MKTSLNRTFARRLKVLRDDRGLTQDRLAALSGLSPDSIRRLETAGFSPTLRVLNQLSRGLEVALPDLLDLEASGEPEKVLRLLSMLTTREDREVDLVLRLAEAALRVNERALEAHPEDRAAPARDPSNGVTRTGD